MASVDAREVRYLVMFEAPDDKTAMNMALKRKDRMEREMLVAVPADASGPAGPS